MPETKHPIPCALEQALLSEIATAQRLSKEAQDMSTDLKSVAFTSKVTMIALWATVASMHAKYAYVMQEAIAKARLAERDAPSQSQAPGDLKDQLEHRG